MKLATWNINSIRARLGLLTDWLQRLQPDVLCVQETKVVDELFPTAALAEVGYHAVFAGEPAYNGVAILSRDPLADVRVEYPLPMRTDKRLISGVYRGVRIYCAYFPNGREPDSEHFQYKLQWIDALGELVLGQLPGGHGPIVLLGDFNVAPEPPDVYDPVALEGKIHFTGEERAALKALLGRGLVDDFRVCRPEPGLYSWWNYRQGMFRRNLGLRIDHVWSTPGLAERVVAADIDREERAKPSPSDHAPVMVEFGG